MTVHRLKIDMIGALSNAVDHLRGTEHPLRGEPTQDDRDGSAAVLEQIIEHCAQLKAGKALPADFLEFYCLGKPGSLPLIEAATDALNEASNAAESWPAYNSAHEGLGVIHEEFDELKAHVWTKQKNRDLPAMRHEAVQLAATAIRFAADVCSEERGRK